MIKISKPMIALAAVIAADLVTAMDMAQSRTHEPSPAAKVSARFPQAGETLLVLKHAPAAPTGHVSAPGKTDRLVPVGPCVREHWPYIADECLVTTDGNKVRRPVRTITIERRIADGPQVSGKTAYAAVR